MEKNSCLSHSLWEQEMAGELPGLPGKNFEENVFERILSKTKKPLQPKLEEEKNKEQKRRLYLAGLQQ